MYSFTSRIRYSEVDENGLLTLPAIVDYLQDCSTFHSEAVDCGLSHVRETGRAWLLASWAIEVRELPRFCDTVRISTWPTAFKGLMASRNFTICAEDEAGENPLVQADSRWFMLDAAEGRPIRVPDEESTPYAADLGPALDMEPTPRRIRTADEGEPAAPVLVTGAHIDTNHHVNNAQYISLALGTLPPEEAEVVRRLDVEYRTAAKLGDTIYPHIHREAGATVVTLDDEAGKTYAAVMLR